MGDEARDAAAFEALLQRSAGMLLLVVDDRLRILGAGVEALRLAGRAADEVTGMSVIAAFGSAALDAVARQALESGQVASGEADLGRPGSRQFAVEAVPLVEGGLVLSLHEITTIRRVERVRRDFVANISHELRTPLASIKLLAETLTGGALDDPAVARDFTVQIAREVDHLAQLVDELLDLSMIESGETKLALEDLDPTVVAKAAAERIGPVADHLGVSVRVIPATANGPGVLVRADAERLGQALLNVAHNAVKYSRPGGEVRIGWEARAASVRFTVSDDGIGIPAAKQTRIFERFYKTDRSRSRDAADDGVGGGSAGLGLAIVRHIAEAHGGSVGVESTEGVGSTFWIDVPRAP